MDNAEKKRKRKSKANKLEFIGWGSKPLVEFLQSIGKEMREYSQGEVSAIVSEYVTSNNLLNPQKKKRVMCDERLYAVFRRKSILRTRIYSLLDNHFIENYDDGSEDESSEEEVDREEEKVALKKPNEKKKKACQEKEEVLKPAKKSCFAALTPDNIKLIYLKRSLVQDLLKNAESFEEKIVGSFVKVRSDPNDYSKKHSFKLLQVIGVRQTSGSGDTGLETFLRLSNLEADVPISLLSDGNFSDEECEELREQVKAGLLKRPTVEEFELKAQVLHRDITKHWIDREIRRLNNRIDHANEKGWRKELFEYIETRQKLKSSSEQERLLSEKPKVEADELEPGESPMDASEKAQEPEQEKLSTMKINAATEEQKPESSSSSMGASEKLKEKTISNPRSIPRGHSYISAADIFNRREDLQQLQVQTQQSSRAATNSYRAENAAEEGSSGGDWIIEE